MGKIYLPAIAMCCFLSLAQGQDTASATSQMIVTVEARKGKEVPAFNRGDVMVLEKGQRLQVTELTPCQNEHAALELFILLDDASPTNLALQFDDLRHFISAQPATTAIGIGYMQNGAVRTTLNLTTDHAQAEQSLRLPLGSPGVSPSPFLSLSELIKKWPASSARHEVLLVTSGVDPLGGVIVDPYLDAAIEHAQRAGVIVYAIYAPNEGHAGHSSWSQSWGQNHLAQLTEETGGEFYGLNFGSPVSFAPYLSDLSQHLAHQYLVTFVAKPGAKPGFQQVRLTTEVPNAEIAAADKVYVPAGR